MIIHTIEIKLDNYFDKWSIYPIGDIHLGNVGCDKLALRKTVREVDEKKDAYWIGMGDYAEFITHLDKRFEPENVDAKLRVQELARLVKHQTEQVIQELSPIQDKCLGIKRGNHEKTVSDRGEDDPARDLAEKLNTKYLGYESMTRIYVSGKDGRKRYGFVIYCHHGFGGGKKPGSHANNMLDLATNYDADLFIMGHVHRIQSMKTARLSLNTRGTLLSKDVAFIISGTYLRMKQEGMEGYEVKKGLPPTTIGSPYVNIFCDHHYNVHFELVI